MPEPDATILWIRLGRVTALAEAPELQDRQAKYDKVKPDPNNTELLIREYRGGDRNWRQLIEWAEAKGAVRTMFTGERGLEVHWVLLPDPSASSSG